VAKERVDILLVAQGLAPSRSRAQAMIMAGQVVADDRRVDKAGEKLDPACHLRLKGAPARYVSRGGDKLAHALATFEGLTVAGCVCVDVGASTGGFTDCLLQNGAAKVYAVDVGWGQLHEKLRQDPRVVVRERTNARHLSPDDFEEPIERVVVDASFIGIAKLIDAIATILPRGELVVLIKPQFEAGKEAASAGRGVIRDPAVRARAIAEAESSIARAGFTVVAGTDSPIAGPKGNLEYLAYAVHRA